MMTRGTVITIGTFDGVHRGHHAVLTEIAARARRSGRRSVLVTFEPHPLEIVNPLAAPPLLTLGAERREILAQSELDLVVFLPFTRTLSQYSPRQFISLLRERYRMEELVIGHDHGFGKGRAGDEHVVRALGEEMGFVVDVVDAVDFGGKAISSTLARRAVAGGDLDTARSVLGRPYSLNGEVVYGAGRGRTIGFPTINLRAGDRRKLLPPDGVYAVQVEWADGSAGGMMHQGPRPTFGDHERSLEVHLLDTSVDLYGAAVKISWIARLRDVRAFDGLEGLKAQLGNDLQATRIALTHPGHPGTN